MKKRLLAVVGFLGVLAIGAMTAQAANELSRVLDLHGSLRDITRSALSGTADFGRLYLLSGNIDNVTIISPSPNFMAEASLTEAYWQDWRTIEQYPSILLLKQPQFADRVSDALSDDPNILSPRKDVLVVVRYKELRQVGAVKIPVLEVIDFRFR
jgi:hypothetical protein